MAKSLVVMLAVIAVFSGCAGVISLQRATEVRQATAAHVAGTAIVVESRNGAIDVVADPNEAEVQITAEITTGGSTQQIADERLEQTELSIERGERGTLAIAVVFPKPYVNGDAAHLTIRLPDAAMVEAITSNGAINVAGFDAPADLRTSNGRVVVRSMSGDVRASTSNGRIVIENCAGDIDASTSNGAIHVTDARGRVRARTSNGAVTVTLHDDAAGPLDLQTSNGAITAAVGAAFGGEVSLLTSNGAIVVDDSAHVVRSRYVQRRRGTVVMSRDGEQSRLRTSNGRIELKTLAEE